MRMVLADPQAACASALPRGAALLTIVLGLASVLADDSNSTGRTPLERAGLAPLFRESFTGGKLDAMRYEPAYGSREQFNSFIQPGAIFLGQKNATENTEQQINYFPGTGEAVQTIEFDVWPTALLESRVLVRPRRFRDGVHVRIGQPGERTEVVFRNEPGGYKIVDYQTPTGPKRGWAHVVVSYSVDAEKKQCEFVAAVNGQVQGRTGICYDQRPGNTAEPFSIEYNGAGADNGYYIANVGGYAEFLKAQELSRLLDGRVVAHLSQMADPTRVEGDCPQLVRVDRSLLIVVQKPQGFVVQNLAAVP